MDQPHGVRLPVCAAQEGNGGIHGAPGARVGFAMSVPQVTRRTIASSSSWSAGIRNSPLVKPATLVLPRIGGLDSSEYRRRLLHMLPGFLPLILWFIPHKDPWGPILADTVIAVTALIVGSALLRFGAFARPGEENGRASVLGYAFPVLATMCLCRGREELGVMTLAVLAFGDGSATLGGLLLGGWRLPWNPRKTLTGLCCFWLIGGTFATAIYWGEARPGVSWEVATGVAGPAVVIAGLLETLRSPWNDNLRVGVASAVVGFMMHLLLVG